MSFVSQRSSAASSIQAVRATRVLVEFRTNVSSSAETPLSCCEFELEEPCRENLDRPVALFDIFGEQQREFECLGGVKPRVAMSFVALL